MGGMGMGWGSPRSCDPHLGGTWWTKGKGAANWRPIPHLCKEHRAPACKSCAKLKGG